MLECLILKLLLESLTRFIKNTRNNQPLKCLLETRDRFFNMILTILLPLCTTQLKWPSQHWWLWSWACYTACNVKDLAMIYVKWTSLSTSLWKFAFTFKNKFACKDCFKRSVSLIINKCLICLSIDIKYWVKIPLVKSSRNLTVSRQVLALFSDTGTFKSLQ